MYLDCDSYNPILIKFQFGHHGPLGSGEPSGLFAQIAASVFSQSIFRYA